MKKLVAAIVASAFALGSVSALAADSMQKDGMKKQQKADKKTKAKKSSKKGSGSRK